MRSLSNINVDYFVNQAGSSTQRTISNTVVDDFYVVTLDIAGYTYAMPDTLSGSGFERLATSTVGGYRTYLIKCTATTMNIGYYWGNISTCILAVLHLS